MSEEKSIIEKHRDDLINRIWSNEYDQLRDSPQIYAQWLDTLLNNAFSSLSTELEKKIDEFEDEYMKSLLDSDQHYFSDAVYDLKQSLLGESK